MTEVPSRVRWMQDIVPEIHNYRTFLKKVFRHEFRKNWFRRFTTPILEKKELFVSAIWEWTDVVDKEMYNVIDKKGRELVLKPESTAWMMRAYIDWDMQSEPQPVNLYYIEPHFRYDRPQKWRYRQFYQIWAEVIWENDPIIDAQLIFNWYTVLNQIGLEWDFKVKLNSIGTAKDRAKYIEELESFYANKWNILCSDCNHRLENNVMRLLDCKNEDCRILLWSAPKITDFFKKESKEHYKKVKEYLDILWVPYEEDFTLVRWLDYYCHTVWEFADTSGRSQDALWGWGRYNWLSQKIWFKDEIPAAWFAMWMERLTQAMIDKWIKIKNKDKIDLYFMQLGEDAKKVVMPLTLEARNAWINTMASLWTPSMKAQLKKANRLWVRFVVIVGIMEAKTWVFQVKDMELWTQEEVKKENIIKYVIDKIWESKLDFYSPTRDLYIEEIREEVEEK